MDTQILIYLFATNLFNALNGQKRMLKDALKKKPNDILIMSDLKKVENDMHELQHVIRKTASVGIDFLAGSYALKFQALIQQKPAPKGENGKEIIMTP